MFVGLYLFVRLNDGVASASWLSAEQRAAVAVDLENESKTQVLQGFFDSFRDPYVWIFCFIYFCAMTGLYGISFWLPTIVAEMGVNDPLQIGLLSALPYAIAGIGMVLIGRHADRQREYHWHTALIAAIGAIALGASALFSKQPPATMFALIVATLGILATPPLFWSLPTAYLRGAGAAAGIAFINSFGCLAGFASPYLVGWIKDLTGSTKGGMYVISGFGALGALLTAALRRSTRERRERSRPAH